MELSARIVATEDIRPWREMYRLEMACQIIHDSIHDRLGWTQEHALFIGGAMVGYGSVAVAGPWRGKPTIYEFYVVPHARTQLFDLFRTLLGASGAVMIAGQSNDPLIGVALHAFSRLVSSEKILFHDKLTTAHAPPGAVFRSPTAEESSDVPTEDLRWRGVVDVGGRVAATGGVLFHYNRPYGDIYMDVATPFRRKGYGSFLVQELKRRCYEAGYVPGARCDPDNTASWRTLQKAGFVPCGHLLAGAVG